MLFGEWNRFIFAPVLLLLGAFISFRKIAWNSTRFIGILLFWLSLESLIGIFAGNDPTKVDGTVIITGAFDIHTALSGVFGSVPSLVLFIGLFLFSLYLIFRISYIKILTGVKDNLPSVGSIKDGIRDFHNEMKQDIKDSKKEGKKETFSKEVETLRAKIESLEK
jgi:hypothetical protein